jgi:hypothetical protein
VDYPPTDNRDFHRTQVIKLQEMKFKSKVNHHQFIYVIHTTVIVKLDLKMILQDYKTSISALPTTSKGTCAGAGVPSMHTEQLS